MPLLVMCLAGLVILITSVRLRMIDSADLVVISVLVFFIAYGMLVGTLLEFGENNRFRFELSPVYHVLAAVVIQHVLALFQRMKLSFKILK